MYREPRIKIRIDMKYIPVDKLIKKFEKMINDIPASVDSGAGYVIDEVYKIINSLQQKQPEVELGEITPSFAENMLCEFGIQSIEDMDSEILAEFARHFWNKGFNARKEE